MAQITSNFPIFIVKKPKTIVKNAKNDQKPTYLGRILPPIAPRSLSSEQFTIFHSKKIPKSQILDKNTLKMAQITSNFHIIIVKSAKNDQKPTYLGRIGPPEPPRSLSSEHFYQGAPESPYIGAGGGGAAPDLGFSYVNWGILYVNWGILYRKWGDFGDF
jgi:hypothetical protein